ncbi:hypothetical protein COHA_009153 [Chlorella ohadii]|uniref:Uncharacterized protein n=1 Tax=Chlorella ohadii TaxID=2649997 RepID=A0AAD5DM98_9CHLO|nr:hypothetical protein COHA_009153 [Chlorella ohadii]
MKNALVKQTQEAVKRSTQLGAPPARLRLGTRARQAAAADAAAAEAERAGEEDANSEAAFFCDDLHQELEQLLSGGGLAPDAAASLAAAQDALGAGRDATRLPPGDLSLPVEGELAPPPFDALVQQLFGADASQDTAAAAAPLPPDEAAGLAAAVSALQLHTAELEARGVLQVAGAPAEHWLLPDGSSRAADDVEFTALPAYLQAAPMSGDRQPFFQAQQRQQAQQGPDERYQHWPSPAAQEAAAAAAESHDAIQEADEGAAWGALEGEVFALPPHPTLQLNLQPQRQAGPAAGGVLVTFDDEPQQPQQQRPQHAWQQPGQNQWQTGGQPWQAHRAGPQQAQQGQATLSDIWEGGDGGTDPWMDQLALSHSQPQQGQQAGWADEGIDEEEDWDEAMLDQVAAMEQQALAQRQQAPPSEQPSQQQQGKRHVPVFRNRAFQQQALPGGAWPVESIEDADSDEEPRPAAAAGPSQAAPAAQRSAAGAVPQLGRRGALPLASQAAAAGEALASDDEEGPQAAAAAPAQQRRPGRRAAPAARAAGTGGQAAVLVDFSAIDVEALRPSVLLRAQTGGRPKWRPVFDPEQLLLQPLRSALQPPPLPPAERQPGGGSHWQAAGMRPGQLASHAASDLMQGITAADLAEWDDWGDEDAAAADAASFDAGGWEEAAGQWGNGSLTLQRQQQQQPVVATEAAVAGNGAGSLAARLAALGVLDPAVPAAAAAAAGKRRHEQIGAEIIQALLEERRRARVDLRPLLQQLSSRLAETLAGGSRSGPGSGGSGAEEAATLTARYLVALLTAAHQHNSGAAAAAANDAEGGAAAAPAAAVAPLAAALAGKQLLLHAPGGATDVQIAAA